MIGTCSTAVLKARGRRREAVTPEPSSGPGPPPAVLPHSARRQTRVTLPGSPCQWIPCAWPCLAPHGASRRCVQGVACVHGPSLSLPTCVPLGGWATVCLFGHVVAGLWVSRLELLRRHLHPSLCKDLYFFFFFFNIFY